MAKRSTRRMHGAGILNGIRGLFGFGPKQPTNSTPSAPVTTGAVPGPNAGITVSPVSPNSPPLPGTVMPTQGGRRRTSRRSASRKNRKANRKNRSARKSRRCMYRKK